MPGGGFVAENGGSVRDYGGGVTFSVVMTCLMAASCGLIFGYDTGVSGGVTQMDSFLSKFFLEVLSGKKNAKRDAYCKYDNQALTAFTSSLFIAGAMSSVVASRVTKRVGCQIIMLIGGALFLSGSIINAAAVNISMLIIGRMLLGFGIGFTLQLHHNKAPAMQYISSVSSRDHLQGGAAHSPQPTMVFAVFGILSATVTNYFTNRIPGGWRISLGIAGIPGAIIVIGALFVLDTSSSLVLRGHLDKARAALQRIRGLDANIDAEFKDITCKPYRQCLVIGLGIPVFFELTGIIIIAVFTPVLFRTVGFNSEKAMLGSVINSITNLVATLLSSSDMDRTGRRFLFIVGGMGLMLCEVAITWLMADHLGRNHGLTMPQNYAIGVLVLICLCTFCSGLSWAPLRWVLPSEIYPVEVRSAGQAMSISVALCLSFLQLQVFIAMLCGMKFAVFLFFIGWLLVMVIFVVLFLPEVKGVPLETMRLVWAKHWYRRRFSKQESQVSSF
ncbi:hypothetical protein ACP4OV_011045 [Aristida adscensionis]